MNSHITEHRLMSLWLHKLFVLFIVLFLSDIIFTCYFQYSQEEMEIVELTESGENETEENQEESEKETERDDYIHQHTQFKFLSFSNYIFSQNRLQYLRSTSPEVATPPPKLMA